jgi:uncharacterized protein YydD (DUF2326 family)
MFAECTNSRITCNDIWLVLRDSFVSLGFDVYMNVVIADAYDIIVTKNERRHVGKSLLLKLLSLINEFPLTGLRAQI